MSDPSKRFVTTVLILGILVLAVAIALGERAGDRVIGQVTEKRLESVAPVTVTPAPDASNASTYGPDWKRSDVMAAAPDPGFPDPRVPPVPPPTPEPPPRYTPAPASTPLPPVATPTPDLNVPIWRRTLPLPALSPTSSGSPGPQASASPRPAQTTQPD